jgi:hypothetical protein
MPTRAIYTFLNFPLQDESGYTFYVHHDGYPSGCAEKIRRALKMCSVDYALPYSFFFAPNMRAERVKDADLIGDLNYKWLFNYRQEKGGVFISGWRRNLAAFENNLEPEWLRVCGPEPLKDFLLRYPESSFDA